MHLSRIVCAVAAVGGLTGLGAATGAQAKGCNGVVNQLVWGCAAWDNNNGPQFPNYQAPPPPAAGSKTQKPVGIYGSNGSVPTLNPPPYRPPYTYMPPVPGTRPN